MAYDIGPRIGIDGESEFRKQLNNINTSLKTLKTELGKVSSEFADNAESEQALIAKNKVLQKSIDQQKRKIEEMKKNFYRCHGTPFDRHFLVTAALFLVVALVGVFSYV